MVRGSVFRSLAFGFGVGVSACSFDVPAPAVFRCEPGGACPMDYTCVAGYCLPPGDGAIMAEPSCTMAVSAGDEHTCAIRADGTAWCWGRNDAGQLGDGTAEDRTLPTQVLGLTGVIAITAGSDHSCAAHSTGVSCWGRNTAGQLGMNSVVLASSPAPVVVAGLSGVVQIALGHSHSCARHAGGTVQCWGANNIGQLGDGTPVPHYTPLPVVTATGALTGVTALVSSGDTACAIDGNAALWCWGAAVEPREATMVASGVASVAVGAEFACWVSNAGGVLCRGANQLGQLGNNSRNGSDTPVEVLLPSTVKATAIVAGARFACARDAKARLWCWGENTDFQLADTTNQSRLTPVLTTFRDVADVGAGGGHVCVRNAGALTCGGANLHGQIGDGRRTTRPGPQPVVGLTGVISLAAAARSSCATLADHTVMCWGVNDFGQLGDTSFIDRPKPTAVEGVSGALSVAVGEFHACALLEGGAVVCWGRNILGELGDGTISDPRSIAQPVVELPKVTQLSATSVHTCARLESGKVMCWGDNAQGQRGEILVGPSRKPNEVTFPDGVVIDSVAVGEAHSCALDSTHKVWCWGGNLFGQLGRGAPGDASPIPAQLGGLANVDQIIAQRNFTCAHVATDGSVWCWGSDSNGQLGDGSHGIQAQPRKVVLRVATTQITTGGSHACARKEDGGVACWGANDAGQVGDSDYADHVIPFDVPGLSRVVSIAGGDGHTCAVLDDTTVSCWGDGRRGELGDGTLARSEPASPALPCN